MDVVCAFPKSISYYQSLIPQIQSRITTVESNNAIDVQLAANLHASVVGQIENSNFTGSEFLGHYAFEIATIIAPAASKIGSTVAKSVSLEVVERYSGELVAASVDRKAMASQLKPLIQKELQKETGTIAAETLDDVVDQSVIKIAQNAGSKGFTRGGNPIRYVVGTRNTVLKQILGGQEVTSLLGGQSHFKSQILEQGKIFRILNAERRNISDKAFHASNALTDQYWYGGGKIYILKSIEVDTIIESRTLNTINSGGSFFDSVWGSILKRIARSVEKEIDWSMTQLIFNLGGTARKCYQF